MKKFSPTLLALAFTLSFSSVISAASVPSSITQAMPIINGKPVISLEKARTIALQKVPNGLITHMELDKENGNYIYDIEILKGQYEYELKLDAFTGTGISLFKDREDWSQNVNIQNPSLSTQYKIIPMSQATDIALNQIPNAQIIGIELDMKNNIPVYTINLFRTHMEYEVAINALTGQVLNIDIDELND
ncbi:MAG: PepSY domain-containing protein [Cellulosilyticaceae bacterium]